MSIILFIIIFSIVILVHEFGHFIIAKKNGIGVLEFSMGLGPTIIGFSKGGTKYSLKLLPFGGACMFEDEDSESASEHAFSNASVWARIATVAAGPIFNFFLAFIFSLFIVGGIGYKPPIINGIIPNSAAEDAGMQAGDKIVKLNGGRILTYKEILFYSHLHQGEKTEVVYERNNEKHTVVLEPRFDEEAKTYYLGFIGNNEYIKGNPLRIIQYSAYEVVVQIKMAVKSVQMLVQGKVSKDDVAGPVGIAVVVGDVYDAAKEEGAYTVILSMLEIAILLSASLGVMNLLPLPALDGGRLVFMVIEAVRGKRIDPEKEGMVHFVGLVLLMILMVFVMYNDIVKLITKT